MNKILISLTALATLTTASNATWIGAWKPDKKVGNMSITVGQATIGDKSNTMYALDLGGNYYYNNNGIMWGASFGLGYTENPDTTVSNKTMGELDGKFRFGYSFGETAKGLGVYAIADFSYLMYFSRNITNTDDQFESANGIGFGAGAEYLFNSGWIITTSFTTTTMTPDTGNKFDYDKVLVGIGFSW